MPSLLGLTPRLLSRIAFSIVAERGAVVRLDEQLPRLGHLDPGQLLERHRRSVVLDDELLDERRRGPPGAHRRELRLDVLDRLVHLVDRFEQRLFDHRPSVTPG